MSSSTRKTTLTINIHVWSAAIVVCLALILGFASTGYGDTIVGNFERAGNTDGFGAGSNDANVILEPNSDIGVTLGHGSLKLTPGKGSKGAYWRVAWAGSPLDFTDANLQFDLTTIQSEWTSGSFWTQVGDKVAINSNGPSGWKEYGPASSSLLAYSFTDRDTGDPTTRWWGSWQADANKTYGYDVSDYDSAGATWMQIAISVQVPDEAFDDNGVYIGGGNFYFDNVRLVTPSVIISKCTVSAGATQYMQDGDFNDMKDSFTASGTIIPPADLNDIDTVVVEITSITDSYVVHTETLTDFNSAVVNSKHKYTHSAKLIKGREGAIASLTLDFAKGKFAITAKNIDLTGLTCPLELKITLGSNELKGRATEAVVNGTKTIPTRLMRAYKDTLIVTPGKTKVKSSAKASSDSLSVSGEIAVEDINTTDPNLYALPVVITWIDSNDINNVQTFTIPANSFKIPKTGHSYKLNSNITPTVAPVAEPNAKISGTIDLDKCTFALSITKADINAVSGLTQFGISFDTPHGEFDEAADVNLAWKK